MRFKLFTLTLVAGALAIPAATAAPGRDKPSQPASKPARACHGKAKVAVVLKGTFVAAGDDSSSFQLNAQRANKHGRMFLKAAQPLSVAVNADTGYVKNDQPAKLSDLTANDRLVVKAKLSKCDLKKATPDALPTLTARQVVDQGPAATAGS